MKNDESGYGNKFEHAVSGSSGEWEMLQEQMEKYVLSPLREGRHVDIEGRRVLERRMSLLRSHLLTLAPEPENKHGEDAAQTAYDWLMEHLQEAGFNEEAASRIAGGEKMNLRYSRIEHEKITSIGTFNFEVSKRGVETLAVRWGMTIPEVVEKLKEKLSHEGYDDTATWMAEGEVTDVEIELNEENDW